MPNWYPFKFTCSKCEAVHWFLPKKCSRCGGLVFRKERNKAFPMSEKNGSEELRLEIDKNRLDEEWVSQPQLYYTWARKAAEAQQEYERAKSELTLTYAELDREVRDNPGSYGIEKLTETIVAETIKAQKEYQLSVKRANEAKYKASVADAAVEAIQHRKRALTMLVELYTHEYYSDPNPKPVSSEGRDFEKQMVRSRGRRRMEGEENEEESDG